MMKIDGEHLQRLVFNLYDLYVSYVHTRGNIDGS